MQALEPSQPFSSPRGLEALADRELFRLSARLGRDRRVAERQFLATLFEIDRRGILGTRRAYGSIQDYGVRVGGVSAQTVTDVVNLGRSFAGYPRSWSLFASGRVGWTLLRTVVPVLGLKSDADWVVLLTTGTKHGLELLVRSFEAASRGMGALGGDRLPGMSGTVARRVEVLPGKDLGIAATALGAGLGFLPTQTAPGSETPGTNPVLPVPPAPPAPAGGRPSPGTGLSAAALAKLEERRRIVEARLGRTLDLDGLVEALLEATEPRRADHPAVPRRVLPGGRADGYVEVVVREVESGRLLRPTRDGWKALSPAAGVLMLREGGPCFDAAALEIGAHASAATSRGREVPPRVERWIWLRSGGACETRACGRRGQHLHHRTRRAAGIDHRPDALRLLCSPCHAAHHAGFINEAGTLLALHQMPHPSRIDQSVIVHRQAARAVQAARQARTA